MAAGPEAIHRAVEKANKQHGSALYSPSDYGKWSVVTREADRLQREFDAGGSLGAAMRSGCAGAVRDAAFRQLTAWIICHLLSIAVIFGALQYVFVSPPETILGRTSVVGILAAWIAIVDCWLLRSTPAKIANVIAVLNDDGIEDPA